MVLLVISLSLTVLLKLNLVLDIYRKIMTKVVSIILDESKSYSNGWLGNIFISTDPKFLA